MVQSNLIGYARKSNAGGAIKLSIDKGAINDAESFEGKDGKTYVQVIANLNRLSEIISGEREVMAVNQLVDDEPEDPQA